MVEYSFLVNLLLVLGSALIGGLLAKKFKQPIIFGYLSGGLLFSLVLFKLGLKRDFLSLFSEVGLALLMFSLGLEFSEKKIEKIKKVILPCAILQIVLTIFFGILVLRGLLGFDLRTAFILSAAFSLSSTAIVVKILEEKGRLETLSGGIMFGWLLVQDLAVLPLIAFLPLWNSVPTGQLDFYGVIYVLVKAVVVLTVTWFLAQKIVPKLTNFIISFKSRELLLLFTIALVFFFAYIISFFGFSFALGAFLIGLILSRSPAHFAIFSEIRPLRDVFLAIFFVSLGLSISPSYIFLNIGKILLVCLLFLFLKMSLSITILAFFKYHAKTILETGFGLAQVGEFAFVYVLAAFSQKYINFIDYSLAISVTLLTMVVTPGLFKMADIIYEKITPEMPKFPFFYRRFFIGYDHSVLIEELPFKNHVVILGYGRVGRWVGSILDKAEISCLVVDYNPQIIRQLRLEGKKVIFGDPADLNVLDFAQVDKAGLVVLALPDPSTLKMATLNCRLLNPKVKIICRSHVEEDAAELKLLGVDRVVQPEFEAALSISHRAMQEMGFKKEDINDKLKQAKKEHEG